jgi:hypothetical protein
MDVNERGYNRRRRGYGRACGCDHDDDDYNALDTQAGYTRIRPTVKVLTCSLEKDSNRKPRVWYKERVLA